MSDQENKSGAELQSGGEDASVLIPGLEPLTPVRGDTVEPGASAQDLDGSLMNANVDELSSMLTPKRARER